jgi:hypothetical protein
MPERFATQYVDAADCVYLWRRPMAQCEGEAFR